MVSRAQTMKTEGPPQLAHRLLVAVNDDASCRHAIERTRQLADNFRCPWLAVHVTTTSRLSDEQQQQLNENLLFAREIGAEVIATIDENIARGLLRIARQHKVTQVVVCARGARPLRGWRRQNVIKRLIKESGNIDVHIVRTVTTATRSRRTFRNQIQTEAISYFMAVAAMAALTVINVLLSPWIGSRAVALNYLLGIVFLAFLVGRGPMLLAATLSALTWNFLFIPPRFTFSIHAFEDAMMFVMYFVIAIVLGQLIAKVRMQEEAERRQEEQSTALYLLTRELAQAENLDDVIRKFVAHIRAVFKCEAAIVMAENNKLLKGHAHAASTLVLSKDEMNTVHWIFTERQATTPFTKKSRRSFLPLLTANERVGVLVVNLPPGVASLIENDNLLDSFARQAALVINRQQLQEYAEQARLLAESERLGKNLLDSISHEMRTPIAAITSASGTLAELHCEDTSVEKTLAGEIETAAARLNRLVGNLLDIARVEAGHLKPKMDWCDIGDLVHVAAKSVEKELSQHQVKVSLSRDLPLVRVDAVLIEHALSNLLLNAAHHTPARTMVEISASVEQDELKISVADSGKGLPPEALARVFNKFYRVPGAPSGGTGLGLSIVKGFVEAQQGRVDVKNRSAGGAEFTIYLPITKAPLVPV